MKAVNKQSKWYKTPDEGSASQEGLSELDQFLNYYASQGWDLVTAFPASSTANASGAPVNDFTLFTFRRELR
jgi:hypothetical protein